MQWIYENNKNNTNRYILGTVGENPLVCIGINPSTAEPNNLDHTLESVDRIRKSNGYDSWIMLNVYPQRATNPEDMHILRDSTIHSENLKHIKAIFKQYKPTIWAAWGNCIYQRPYLVNCLSDIVKIANDNQCKWVIAGEPLKDGHPHHPLYMNNASKLQDFSISEYLKNASANAAFSYINTFKNDEDYSISDLYELLEIAKFINYEYQDCFETAPIDLTKEMEKLKFADFNQMKAFITASIREDYFSNGLFDKRAKNGDVGRILRKLRSCYKNSLVEDKECSNSCV